MTQTPSPQHEPLPTDHQPDEGTLPLAVFGGLVGAALGAAIFFLAAGWLRDQVVPGLAVGPVVGLAVRLLGRGRDTRFRTIAAVCAVLSYVTGFIWADSLFYEPFMLEESVKRLLTLQALIIHAFNVYLAYLIAARRRA